MIERAATWGEVAAGTTLLSPTDLPLVVVKTAPGKNGGLWYLAHDHGGRKFNISPKPSDAPVTILECTPEEAEFAAINGLGAERILEMEREVRMPWRARRWLVPAFPTGGRGALSQAQMHLNWYHGTYVTDIKTIKAAVAAHDEMHRDQFMDKPHTHRVKGE